jgi:acetylornithine/succinyldiaminopimelate/putrescine aminotransferase
MSISWNSIILNDLNLITNKTACVVAETVQAEAGVILPENQFLKKLRRNVMKPERC